MATGYQFDVVNQAGVVTGTRYFAATADGRVGAELPGLPTGAQTARIGYHTKRDWTPEAVRQFNPFQFLSAGETPYYSPNYEFGADVAGNLSIADLRKLGTTRFSQFITGNRRGELSTGELWLYETESGYHESLEGWGVYASTLQVYYNKLHDRVAYTTSGDTATVRRRVLNTETSLYPSPLNSEQGGSFNRQFFPNWDSIKNNSVLMESTGETKTWEAINNSGQWETEIRTRRGNRLILLLEVTRERSVTGTRISQGYSPHQGQPTFDGATSIDTFMDGDAKVIHIGGDSQGNITLNVPSGGTKTYRLNGTVFDHEDSIQGYWYPRDPEMSASDYNRFFQAQESGLQNFPAFWGLLNPTHVVANEKGYRQENFRKSVARGWNNRRMVRQVEVFYEGDNFTPFLSGTLDGSTPKPELQPVRLYSQVLVSRFMAGDDPGNGYWVFPKHPGTAQADLTTVAYENCHHHAKTALFKARIDAHPLERFFPGSTLIEDPEVRINNTGSFSAYNAVAAANYTNGVQGVWKPAAMLRYKATPTGWQVWILIGMGQEWDQQSDHAVRALGGLLNGNIFLCRCFGEEAMLYGFAVSSADTGQTYEARPEVAMNKRKKGYPILLNQ